MERKTPLYEIHMACKGKIVPFAGYLLPVHYEQGVIAEHMAVRTAAGLFDVSHMGEVMISGRDALANVQYLFTNDCSKLVDGQVKYSPMCKETGGILDDVLIYRIHQESYLIVVNASNRHKDVEWIKEHLFGDVEGRDCSDEMAQLALQGPKAHEIVSKLTTEELPVKFYTFKEGMVVAGVPCLVSRTGYTGEDGFEFYCKPEDAVTLWDGLMMAGKDHGLLPCGLGARDTLRLESGMPLYGHEMGENLTPQEVGLGYAAKLHGKDFIGRAAMIAKGEPKIARVGLEILGRGIAREQHDIYIQDKKIGYTTSGTHCPYLGHPVAMGLIDIHNSDIDTRVEVDIRGRRIEAKITPLPFYHRK